MQIPGKKVELFTKSLPNGGRSIFQGVEHPVRKVDLHRPDDLRFFAIARRRKLRSIDAIASAAVANGP
jgi:hypothetical protein